jgi:hypothetical protein
MVDFIQEEKRVLNALFSTKEKIYEWEFDSLRLDLNYMQRALLKRVYCRNESLAEIATHLQTDEEHLRITFDAALRKLERHHHAAQTPQISIFDRRLIFPSCEGCGRKLKQKRGDTLCSSCLRDEIRAHTSVIRPRKVGAL